MKKILLPLLLILAVGMLAAVESEPSEVVGYFKKTINAGSIQTFTLPFAYNSFSVNDIIGDQFAEDDFIMDINLGISTTYYSGYGWFGDLTDLEYGNAYYANRAISNGQNTYFLLGKVDPQPFTKTIMGNGSCTAFGLNEARPINIIGAESPFGILPSEDDFVVEIDTGASTTYYEGYGWFGDLEVITPTYGYYYKSAIGSNSFVWTYTPSRSSFNKQDISDSKVKK
ncbi:MAG: hypothetical protein BWY18_00388 [Candidatus Cloacimonetes bacterium ADurb.Bin211]|jgi:hypothetical protein|nr:MAG: hypothetical protein BWY18_00388 [Candidatus Cloacimonetes bacterium ADurb.Bin211]